jgi:hypothetical protein
VVFGAGEADVNDDDFETDLRRLFQQPRNRVAAQCRFEREVDAVADR